MLLVRTNNYFMWLLNSSAKDVKSRISIQRLEISKQQQMFLNLYSNVRNKTVMVSKIRLKNYERFIIREYSINIDQ